MSGTKHNCRERLVRREISIGALDLIYGPAALDFFTHRPDLEAFSLSRVVGQLNFADWECVAVDR
jgi:hypothetical protein